MKNFDENDFPMNPEQEGRQDYTRYREAERERRRRMHQSGKEPITADTEIPPEGFRPGPPRGHGPHPGKPRHYGDRHDYARVPPYERNPMDTEGGPSPFPPRSGPAMPNPPRGLNLPDGPAVPPQGGFRGPRPQPGVEITPPPHDGFAAPGPRPAIPPRDSVPGPRPGFPPHGSKAPGPRPESSPHGNGAPGPRPPFPPRDSAPGGCPGFPSHGSKTPDAPPPYPPQGGAPGSRPGFPPPPPPQSQSDGPDGFHGFPAPPHRSYDDLTLENKLDRNLHLISRAPMPNRMSGQKGILAILSEANRIPQRRLQEMLGIRAGSISETINKLETAGLVSRFPDENDKRCTLVALTDAGKLAADALGENASGGKFSCLTQEEKETLLMLLEKIAANIPGPHNR